MPTVLMRFLKRALLVACVYAAAAGAVTMSVNPVTGSVKSFDITTIRKVTYTLQPAPTMNVMLTDNTSQVIAISTIRSVTFQGMPSSVEQGQVDKIKSNLVAFNMRRGRMPSISFAIDKPEAVRVSVYTVSGRLVRSVANNTFAVGDFTVFWDGLSERGQKAPAGNYIMTIDRPARTSAFKFVVIK